MCVCASASLAVRALPALGQASGMVTTFAPGVSRPPRVHGPPTEPASPAVLAELIRQPGEAHSAARQLHLVSWHSPEVVLGHLPRYLRRSRQQCSPQVDFAWKMQ